MMWDYVLRNLSTFVQIIFPLSFFAVDLLVKWTSGKDDFKDLGADVCFSGFSLYVGVLLALVSDNQMQNSAEIVTGVIFAFAAGWVWWFCIVLSYNKIPVPFRGRTGAGQDDEGWLQPGLALVIGSVTTYYLAGLAWKLISEH